MSILVDTNILVRLRDEDDPAHANCALCLEFDRIARHQLCICTQVLIEYWTVATRPISSNGLGATCETADDDIEDFLTALPLIQEPPDVLDRWRRLVVAHDVKGRPSHDARIVAVMEAHGIKEILTLNPADFSRFSQISCLTPAEVLARG